MNSRDLKLGSYFLRVLGFLCLLALSSCEKEKKNESSEDRLQKLRDAVNEAKKVTWRTDTIEKKSQKIFYEQLENLKNLRDLENIGSDKWKFYNDKVSVRLISIMVDLEEEFGKVNRDNVQAFILKKYFGVTL